MSTIGGRDVILLLTAVMSIIALSLALYAATDLPLNSSPSTFGISRVSYTLPKDVRTLSHDRHSRTIRNYTKTNGPVGIAFIRYSRRLNPSYWDVVRGMVDRRRGIVIPSVKHHLVHAHQEEGRTHPSECGYDHALEKMDKDPKIQVIVSAGGTGFSQSDCANQLVQRFISTEIPGFSIQYAVETMKNVDAGKHLNSIKRQETASRNVVLSRPFAFFTHRGTIVVGCSSPPNAVECALNAIVPSLPALVSNMRYTDTKRSALRGYESSDFNIQHREYIQRLNRHME